jgi:preprotein translocase subunit SecG
MRRLGENLARALRLSRSVPSAAMSTILGVVQVFLSVVLIFLVLMHSGKDSGLSGAFGVGTGAGPVGGGSLVERNLNRWTIGFAIAFVINTIILIKIS